MNPPSATRKLEPIVIRLDHGPKNRNNGFEPPHRRFLNSSAKQADQQARRAA